MPEIIPYRSLGRYHIRLVPTVFDDRVRSMQRIQMFTLILPAYIHEFDRISGTTPSPWRPCGMCRLTFKSILHGDQPRSSSLTIAHAEVVTDMCKYRNVHIIKISIPSKKRLSTDELFCNSRPQHQCTLESLSLHNLFDVYCSQYIEW